MLLQSADVCLADLCEMLHCDHFVQGHGSSFKSFQQRTAPCRPKLKGQLKHHCQVRVCGLYLLHVLERNEYAAQLLSQLSELACSEQVVMHQQPICCDMQRHALVQSTHLCTWYQSLTTLLTQKQPCLQDVADVCFPIADGREATLMHGELSNAFYRLCSSRHSCFVHFTK